MAMGLACSTPRWLFSRTHTQNQHFMENGIRNEFWPWQKGAKKMAKGDVGRGARQNTRGRRKSWRVREEQSRVIFKHLVDFELKKNKTNFFFQKWFSDTHVLILIKRNFWSLFFVVSPKLKLGKEKFFLALFRSIRQTCHANASH